MRKAILILFVILLGSCSRIERTPKPDPFFDTQEMADIMTDVYLVEGSMTANRKSFAELGIIADDYIYQKHNIDSVSFSNNFNYYADRVDEFLLVLDIVDEKLAVIKDSVNTRQLNSKKPVTNITPANLTKIPDSLKSSIKSYPTESK
ncbi:MAG: DUF4296 domain-containing protein [Nonlabens sp.]|uniref:DUF4296 domain-containing protein n=1 Tax=Nonlabens sp. TaxID=1888209 RepID=UPI003EF58529